MLKPPFLRASNRPTQFDGSKGVVVGAVVNNPLPALEMPRVLFRLQVQLVAAVYVPTPNDPFLESHHADPLGHKCQSGSFMWWTPPAAALVEGEAKLCDPIVSCEVHGGLFAGAGQAAGGAAAGAGRASPAGSQPLSHGSVWESEAVKSNGLNPQWEDAHFEIISSHPEISQAMFVVGYRTRPTEKLRQLALGAINLSCVRPGLRCFSLREPKHGLPLRFTKLLLRVSKDTLPLESLHARPASRSSP